MLKSCWNVKMSVLAFPHLSHCDARKARFFSGLMVRGVSAAARRGRLLACENVADGPQCRNESFGRLRLLK